MFSETCRTRLHDLGECGAAACSQIRHRIELERKVGRQGDTGAQRNVHYVARHPGDDDVPAVWVIDVGPAVERVLIPGVDDELDERAWADLQLRGNLRPSKPRRRRFFRPSPRYRGRRAGGRRSRRRHSGMLRPGMSMAGPPRNTLGSRRSASRLYTHTSTARIGPDPIGGQQDRSRRVFATKREVRPHIGIEVKAPIMAGLARLEVLAGKGMRSRRRRALQEPEVIRVEARAQDRPAPSRAKRRPRVLGPDEG